MRTLSFKVDEEEEKAIRYRMHVTGQTNLSRHLRRVVLSGGNENEQLLGALARQIDRVDDAVRRNQKLLMQIQDGQKGKQEMQLDMLAGIYLMLHSAVEPEFQAKMDKYVDVDSVRTLLGDFEDDEPQAQEPKPDAEGNVKPDANNGEPGMLKSFVNKFKGKNPDDSGKAG